MNPAVLRRMKEMGLTLDQAIELIELMTPVRSKGAERQARYAAKKKDIVISDVSNDVIADVTLVSPTPPSLSEPKGSSRKDITTRGRPSRRVPERWTPTVADLAVGAELGFTPGEIDRELAKIRDHQFGTAKSDWSATFRNWIRNAADRRPVLAPMAPNDRRTQKFDAKQDNFRRALAGAEAAARGRLGG